MYGVEYGSLPEQRDTSTGENLYAKADEVSPGSANNLYAVASDEVKNKAGSHLYERAFDNGIPSEIEIENIYAEYDDTEIKLPKSESAYDFPKNATLENPHYKNQGYPNSAYENTGSKYVNMKI